MSTITLTLAKPLEHAVKKFLRSLSIDIFFCMCERGPRKPRGDASIIHLTELSLKFTICNVRGRLGDDFTSE